MRTRIKICCIGAPQEAETAVAAGADALGLVAAMPSGPGPIADELIAEIAAASPPPIATFLLTSETRAAAIAAHIDRTRPAAVQIVSHIAADESAELAALRPHIRRVQVIHVEGPQALELIPLYSPFIHAFLLDSGRPGAATPELGGTGRAHDWSISAAFVAASPRPVFLAGGLAADNVGEAIRRVRPFGVDVCSGVRRNGALDPTALRAFVRAVRAADGG